MRRVLTTALLTLLDSLTNPCRADVLDVSVRAGVWVRPAERSRMAAVLQVTVGWEELLFGRHSPGAVSVGQAFSTGLAQPPSSPDQAAPGDGAPDPADTRPENATQKRESQPSSEPVPGNSPSGKQPADGAPPKPESNPISSHVWLKPAFARALVHEALRQQAIGETRTDSLSNRSRVSAVLPVLRLRAGRGTDESLRYSPTNAEPDRWLISGGADLSYEAQATWTLDRLVFADDEIAIERLRQQAQRARGQRALEALKLLFRWQTARVKLEMPEHAADISLQLSMIQAEIELDVLTRGWFSRQLQSSDDT
jgi:hypothetical protein